jgi:hypothetical protein
LHSTLELVELERLADSSHKVHILAEFVASVCAVEEVPMGGPTEAQFYSAVGQ